MVANESGVMLDSGARKSRRKSREFVVHGLYQWALAAGNAR